MVPSRSALVRRATTSSVISVAVAVVAFPLTVGAAAAGLPARSFDLVFTRFASPDELGSLVRTVPGSGSEAVIRPVFDAAVLSPGGDRFVDFSPTEDDRGSAAVFAVDGSDDHVLPLTEPNLDLPGGAWSRGSERIVAEGWGRDGNPVGVSIYSRRVSDGGGLLRLTDAGDRHDYPVRSAPDGSSLIFFRPDAPGATGDSAAQDAFVVGADGTGLRRLSPTGMTTAFTFSHDAVSWAPDGRHVAMVLARGDFWSHRSRSVYVVDPDGTNIRRIGPHGDIWDAVWSPDGRWIAFSLASPSGGPHQLVLMRPDGTGVRALTSDAARFSLQPVWSPDSRRLAFIRGVTGTGRDDIHQATVWTIDTDGRDLTAVTDVVAEYRGIAWLP